MLGAGSTYAPDDTGGADSHNHLTPVSRTGGDQGLPNTANAPWGYGGGPTKNLGVIWPDTTGNYSNWMRTSNTDHKPKYYALAYIMKD